VNANVISIAYTGTPALKTDFTRTGKRTTKGAIDDGVNAVQRYYYNNLTDGYNQDCLDLCLGFLKPSKQVKKRGFMTPLKLMLFTYLVFAAIVAAAFNAHKPAQHDQRIDLLHKLCYAFIALAFFSSIKSKFPFISRQRIHTSGYALESYLN